MWIRLTGLKVALCSDLIRRDEGGRIVAVSALEL
jgi:hypothetical protein